MSQLCHRCGKPVSPGFRFCNECGQPVEDIYSAAEDVVPYSQYIGDHGRAIRVLNGDLAGRFFDAWPSIAIGSGPADAVFEDDRTMSPLHARIETNSYGAILQDMGSLNGVFLRARDKILLQDHDIIRAGEHYFLYECLSLDTFSEDSHTDFYAAPCRGEYFRLVEILSGGRRGRACVAPDGGIIVGRSEGDFVFPDDEKMSLRHFTIRWTQRGGILVDNSANGTFVQIHEATQIAHGDTFFVGNELFALY